MQGRIITDYLYTCFRSKTLQVLGGKQKPKKYPQTAVKKSREVIMVQSKDRRTIMRQTKNIRH